MKRLHFLLVVVAISFFEFRVQAQDLETMQFDLLDEEDGLSNHAITRMLFDKHGYLWIGTLDGLNRYDGYSFKTFKHIEGDSSSLQSNFIGGLALDKNNNLWVGYADHGISRFDESCQCFKNFYGSDTTKTGLKNIAVGTMLFDSQNKLWFSSKASGLNKFDPMTGSVKNFHLPNIDSAYTEPDFSNYNGVGYVFETDSLLWLCTANGLYSFDSKAEKFIYYEYAPIDVRKSRNDFFLKLVPNGTKGFWLTSWGGGISYFDVRTKKFTNYKYISTDLNTALGNIVNEIVPKNENEFWVLSSEKGLGVFDKRTGHYTFNESKIANENNFPIRFAAYAVFAEDGTMFVSCESGLMKYSPYSKLFNYKALPISSSQNNDKYIITSVIDDSVTNKLYFCVTYGNGFNVLDKATGKLTAYPVDIAKDSKVKYTYLRSELLDSHGTLWLMTRDFIYQFNRFKNKLVKITSPYEPYDYDHSPSFAEVVEDRDGDIWIATYGRGLIKFSYKENKFTTIDKIALPDTTLKLTGISFLNIDKFNRLWFVTFDDRVVAYDKTSKIFNLPLNNTTIRSGNVIDGLKMDKSGNAWIILKKKGIAKIKIINMDSVSCEMVTTKNGLPSENITTLQCDAHNNMWIATFSGIVMFNADNMKSRVFNQSAGIDISFANTQFATANSRDFYLATWGRYCKVNYEAIDKKLPVPKVYIDKFKVYDKDVITKLTPDNVINLRPKDDFFSFDFGCIDYVNTAHTKFAYKLEGWDKDWVYCGSRRYASYTNLDGGKYTFRVKASNDAGQWSEEAQVPLYIMTPLYKKGWFIAVLALFFYGIIYSLYRYRIGQIEKTEKLKTEFNQELAETRMQALRAQMNPHFIFNCLNSINRYIIKSDVKTASLYLTKFAKLIRLILDNSENKKVVLSNELEALKLYIEMEALRFDNKFSYNLKVQENVGADSIEVPQLIIQPYVENAIWHGLLHKEESGNLKINVSKIDGNLICEIEDNGVGRDKAREFKSKTAVTRKSVGMKLTEERLRILNTGLGSFSTVHIVDLRDDAGEACGTKVILQIPV